MVDLASFLNNSLAQSSPGSATYGSGTRTAVLFTSTLREGRPKPQKPPRGTVITGTGRAFDSASFGPAAVAAAQVSQIDPTGGSQLSIAYEPALPVGTGSAGKREVIRANDAEPVAEGRVVNRTSPPAVWSGSDFFNGLNNSYLKVIEMAINPKSVKFTQPKRWTKKDTRTGSVFFHFNNTRGQNNDILTMSFQGNTGNIDTRAYQNPNEIAVDHGGLRKFIIWHNLYLLTREPLLLADNTENVFRISYQSPLLTQTIDFYGFFNAVLDFTENAEKPHSRDYSFDFTVTRTSPDLDGILNAVTAATVQQIGSDVPLSANILGTNFGTTNP